MKSSLRLTSFHDLYPHIYLFDGFYRVSNSYHRVKLSTGHEECMYKGIMYLYACKIYD